MAIGNTQDSETIRKAMRMIGGSLAIICACLAFTFGMSIKSEAWQLRWLFAFGLTCAALGSAYMWTFVRDAIKSGNRGDMALAIVFAALFTMVDCMTAFGTVSFHRTSDVDRSIQQTQRHDIAFRQVERDQKDLTAAKALLAKMQDDAKWDASVTADGLRAQLTPLDQQLKDRATQCGRKCRIVRDRLMAKKAGIEERIAYAEEKTALQQKIEKLSAVLEQKEATAGETAKGQSVASSLNVELASFGTQSLQPDEEAIRWADKFVNWGLALFFVFGSIGANLHGWGGAARAGALTGAHPVIPALVPVPRVELDAQQITRQQVPAPVAEAVPVPIHSHNSNTELHDISNSEFNSNNEFDISDTNSKLITPKRKRLGGVFLNKVAAIQ